MQAVQDEAGVPGRSGWRFFPWVMVAALGVVVAVNVLMAVLAARSAPGVAVEGSFRRSNTYSLALDAAERQARLGWSVAAEGGDGHAVILLAGRDGLPLEGAAVSVTAQRPIGREAALAVAVRAEGGGRFAAVERLPLPGQWDLLVEVRRGEDVLRTMRRVIVP